MLAVKDGLDAFLLGCFLFGLIFSFVSLFVGSIHIGAHHLALPRHHAGGPPGTHAGHAAHDARNGHHSAGDHLTMSPLNTGSILAFVSWFGGVGYVLRDGLGIATPLSLLVGLVGGVIGAWLIYQFLAKVIAPYDRALDPEDYRLPGTLARVIGTIRPGGTGEIVFEQGGVRIACPARSRDGEVIARGSEVVVLSYERGIAQVGPWDDLLGATRLSRSDPPRGVTATAERRDPAA